MTKDKINEFTARISQANKSQIIVIMYEMAIEYIEEALATDNHAEYISNCVNAIKVIWKLKDVLSFEKDLGYVLENFYMYIAKIIGEAEIKNCKEKLSEAKKHLEKMKAAFEQVAKEDTSDKLMINTEKIFTGLTYGRQALYDNLTTEVSRGVKI